MKYKWVLDIFTRKNPGKIAGVLLVGIFYWLPKIKMIRMSLSLRWTMG